MKFEPLNDRHAIARVAFGIYLDSDLEREEHDRVARAHDRWEEILPRVDNEPFVAGGVGSPRPVPAAPPLPPIVFQRMAPTGQVEGELRAQQDSIATHWTGYSSWDAAWGTARYLFDSIMDCLNHDRCLRATELQYLDIFSATDEPSTADFRDLIDSGSKLLPPDFFDQGPLWHLDRGRFRTDADMPRQASRLLERMHVDCVRASPEHYRVRFDNYHRFDLRPGFPAHAITDRRDAIDSIFASLHTHAKALLRQYLTTSMADRISLDAA